MDPRRDEIEKSSSLLSSSSSPSSPSSSSSLSSSLSSSTLLLSTYDNRNLPFGFSSLTSRHVVSIDVDETHVNTIVDSGD